MDQILPAVQGLDLKIIHCIRAASLRAAGREEFVAIEPLEEAIQTFFRSLPRNQLQPWVSSLLKFKQHRSQEVQDTVAGTRASLKSAVGHAQIGNYEKTQLQEFAVNLWERLRVIDPFRRHLLRGDAEAVIRLLSDLTADPDAAAEVQQPFDLAKELRSTLVYIGADEQAVIGQTVNAIAVCTSEQLEALACWLATLVAVWRPQSEEAAREQGERIPPRLPKSGKLDIVLSILRLFRRVEVPVAVEETEQEGNEEAAANADVDALGNELAAVAL
ncbi:hypothetical protein Agub_g3387 [Astrephomene gubernaculifera]|uniref:Uncharacterized protein n=1 Tax=Astrephomene gubernaculifera TaxID=47775 RepID=A0AAD3DL65_9CHLO|nr:hypothetical protein Agub_g3387 [Astrephomene gubernaculifera]